MTVGDDLQFFKEEVRDGAAVYSVYLKKVRYHTPLDDDADIVGVSASANDGAAHLQWRLEEVRVIKAGTLQYLVAAITNESSGEVDSTYVNTLLATYRTFATASNLLAELISRYCEVRHDQHFPQQLQELCQRSLRMVLTVWIDKYPEDFREPFDYPTLNAALSFALNTAFDNELAEKAQGLLYELKARENTDILSGHGLVDDLIKSTRRVALSDLNQAMPRRFQSPLDVLDINSQMFAGQLTYIDAELFKNVVPHHCLGAVWSRRADKKCAVSPVTVLATVDQFNAVSYRVISTILKGPYKMPRERALVIDKWIEVAQECRYMKNFSSLKAIVAGLQAHAVFRLKKVWDHVSKDKHHLFNELADIFNETDNQGLWRELLNREGTAKFADTEWINSVKRRGGATLSRKTRRPSNYEVPHASTMQGTVPYLGTFLTDLTMVDTANKDITKEGLINFEKRRKEFELLTQIQMLQSVASLYQIVPDVGFFDWFYNVRVYDDAESYELSREIEPNGNVSTISQQTQRKSARSSLGFFAQRSHKLLDEGHLTNRGSTTSLHLQVDDEAPIDTRSISSMHELYSSTPQPRFRHSISMTSVKSLSLFDSSFSSPFQSEEMIAVKVYLQIPENLQTNHYKSILLSNTDHARVFLRNTLVKYDVIVRQPEDLAIIQLLPDKTELVMPERGNIFYAIRRDVSDICFIVRRRRAVGGKKQRKVGLTKHRSSGLLGTNF